MINIEIYESFYWIIYYVPDPLNLIVSNSFFDMNSINGGFELSQICNSPEVENLTNFEGELTIQNCHFKAS